MKMNRVIALMIGLLLTFSMTACGEQMSAMNTDMKEKTEEKSAMDMDEKMEESSDMNMMEGKTEEQLLAVENDILFANNALWEKVFMSMDKNVNDDMLSSNYGDVLMSAAEPLHMFHLPIEYCRRSAPPLEYRIAKRVMDIVVSALALAALRIFKPDPIWVMAGAGVLGGILYSL